MWYVTVERAYPSSAAAELKLLSRATTEKVSSHLKSISFFPY
jgi:hypothetical protein